MKVSVVMPAYNEAATVGRIVEQVLGAPVKDDLELVVVDDGSTNGTRECLTALAARTPAMRVILHEANQGKGRAVRTGIAHATGDVVILQDADLEYDPRDYPALLAPIAEDRADVVFSNRFHGGAHRTLYYRHYVANRLLTTLCNLLTDLNLSDVEAGYKVFKTGVLKQLSLRARGFDIDPELVVKTARLGVRIYEVPISYHGRTYEEGKKISWRDGLTALWRIPVYRFFG